MTESKDMDATIVVGIIGLLVGATAGVVVEHRAHRQAEHSTAAEVLRLERLAALAYPQGQQWTQERPTPLSAQDVAVLRAYPCRDADHPPEWQ